MSGSRPPISERAVRDALRRVLPNTHLPTPAGHLTINREAVLDEVGVETGEEAELVDRLLAERGVEVLPVERTRSLTLGAEAALKPGPAPTLFYVVPEELVGR